MDGSMIDLDDVKPSALKRMLKEMLLKGSKKKDDGDDADKEREDLADLHAEKGDGKAPKVEEDDLPKDVRDALGEEDSEDEDKPVKSPMKKGKKPSSFAKGGKKSFPFQKKKD